MARRRAELDFPSVSIEGALFPADFLARIAHFEAAEQSESDYRVPKKLKLRDELGRFFRIAEGLWQDFQSLPVGKGRDARKATVEGFLVPFLRQVLGFEDLTVVGTVKVDGRDFPIGYSAIAGRVPLVLASRDEEPDAASERYGDEHRRRSPFLLAQEYLNAGAAQWAMVSNGHVLRLLRDNPSLTRPAYLEFDLQRMFEERLYPDFAVLWLTCHASRFGAAGTSPTDCALERWKGAAQQEGTRARNLLRFGVADALRELGTGFLSVPGNSVLRERIERGELTSEAFYQQLLRLIYRFLFLFTIEERGQLHPESASPESVELYRGGYSLANLRMLASKRRRFDKHIDLWQALVIAFSGLQKGEPSLGLPPLGGLFRATECPDLESADLPNYALLEAIYRLAYFVEDGALVRVNYRDMGSEELGSIYEALLELVPEVDTASHPWRFRFIGDDASAGGTVSGNARKLTGSYYTPDSLVQELIRNALEPVIAERLRSATDGAKAILSIRVLDPACGSGHFLLAAARRLAESLARVRVSEGEPTPLEYRHALREVITHCIYGVDRNELALELARTALWLESFMPESALGFLDHHLRCGDALVGLVDPQVAEDGIPSDAFKHISDDDKDVCKRLSRKNDAARSVLKNERERLRVMQELALYDASGAHAIETMPDETLADIEAKRDAFERGRRAGEVSKARRLADCFVAAFFSPKTPATEDVVPTTEDLHRLLRDVPPRRLVLESAHEQAQKAHAFHWRLEFPVVFEEGGFDVVLGNPPWETMSPDAKEYFSVFEPTIGELAPEVQQARITEILQNPTIARKWSQHCRDLYTQVRYFKDSGRYRLFAKGNLGKGDFNVYRMFVELALALVRDGGYVAQIVPENFYNGGNAAGIRQELFDHFTLTLLLGFENTRRAWFEAIDTRAKFAFYSARKGGRTEAFRAAFAITSNEGLTAAKQTLLEIPVSLVDEFAPDARSVMEFSNQLEIDISRKMYSRYRHFGKRVTGLPHREYMREVDMGNDRDLFDSDRDGLPVFQGSMVTHHDYRAKGYVSGHGRNTVWEDLPFGHPSKAIRPQWYISRDRVPSKIRQRIQDYRVGFCDIGRATDQRSLMAALIPPRSVCGHTVPTITFEPRSPLTMMLWLAVANSLAMDYIVRQKVALHLSLGMIDTLPLPREVRRGDATAAVAARAARLSLAGTDMNGMREELSGLPELAGQDLAPILDPVERARVSAEIDALVGRDVYGLSKREMAYVLDPKDVLGASCTAETFRALKDREIRDFGEYRTRRLVLEAWDRIESNATLARSTARTVGTA